MPLTLTSPISSFSLSILFSSTFVYPFFFLLYPFTTLPFSPSFFPPFPPLLIIILSYLSVLSLLSCLSSSCPFLLNPLPSFDLRISLSLSSLSYRPPPYSLIISRLSILPLPLYQPLSIQPILPPASPPSPSPSKTFNLNVNLRRR